MTTARMPGCCRIASELTQLVASAVTPSDDDARRSRLREVGRLASRRLLTERLQLFTQRLHPSSRRLMPSTSWSGFTPTQARQPRRARPVVAESIDRRSARDRL